MRGGSQGQGSASEGASRARAASRDGRDYTEAVTWLFLALEAAVTAIAERHGLSVESKHWQKLEVAEELRRQGHVSDDLAGAMRTLNEGRKAAVYEGEEPDLDGQSLEDLAALVESVVEIATGSES